MTVKISKAGRKEGQAHSLVHRPILWPVCPRIGEAFWVSKTTDYFFDVIRVAHWPAGDEIEISFETDNIDDLTNLLGEENGGWLNGDEPGVCANMAWPTPEDHPTATV